MSRVKNNSGTRGPATRPFPCPSCGTKLQASNRYAQWMALGSLALSLVASLVSGFRGLHLLYAVLVLLVVIDYLAIHLLKYAVPPKIVIAVPPDPLRQVVREIMGPSELNLRDRSTTSPRAGRQRRSDD
jgi:hypothetical protein